MKQIKRLDEKPGRLTKKPAVKKSKDNTVFVTESIVSKEEAIDLKMKTVEPKLLGKKLVQYEVKGLKKVWIPYYLLVYHYDVNPNIFFRKSSTLSKSGVVAVVYDVNEMHASHYDILTDGEIPLVKRNILDDAGEIIGDHVSQQEILENAERSVQRQIIWKAYKVEAQLQLERKVKFYREAWELTLGYKDRTYMKYAYMDEYGVSNERARGLRGRLDGGM